MLKTKTPMSLRSFLAVGLAFLAATALFPVQRALAVPPDPCAFASTEPTNDFLVAENWSCGRVPTSADTVLIPNGTTTNLIGEATVYQLSTSGTVEIVSSGLTVSGTTTVETGGTIHSTNSSLTFGGVVTSTGILSLVSGSALFSDALNNNGTFSIGSATATTTGAVANAGTFSIDTGTLVVRNAFTISDGTFSPGTGTVILHNATNAMARGFNSETNTTFNDVIVRGTNQTYFSYLANHSTATVNGSIDVESGTLGIDGVIARGSVSARSRLYNNGTSLPFSAYGTTTFSGAGYFYGRQGSSSTFFGDVVFADDATGGFDLSMSGNDGDRLTFYKRLLTSSETYFLPGNFSTVHFAATSTPQTVPDGYAFDNLEISNALGVTLLGDLDVNETLTVSGSLDLDDGTLTISGEDDPITITGDVDFASSTVRFDANGDVTIPSLAYWNLTTSSTGATITDHVTTTNAFTNLGTLTIASGKRLSAPTFTNSGTITETGSIIHPLTSLRLTDADGNTVTSFSGYEPDVYVTLQDDDANLSGSTVDTITSGAVVQVTGFGDTVVPTFRETAAASGIFRAGPLPIRLSSRATGDDALDAVQSGTVSVTFVDTKDASDTGSASAAFRLSDRGGGGVALEPAPPLGPRPSPSADTRSPLGFRINGGEETTSARTLTLTLDADPATVRGYALSLDPDFPLASLLPYAQTVSYSLPDTPGTYRLHLRYYSRNGHPSETMTRTIRYEPAAAVPPTAPMVRFTRTLRLGSRGEDVRRLARFLNENGFTLALRGPGAHGQETTYFGPLLARALTRFQEAHAEAILTPLGLTRGTGTLGAATRSYLHQLR